MGGSYNGVITIFFLLYREDFEVDCENAQSRLPMSGKNICIGRIDIRVRTQYT